MLSASGGSVHGPVASPSCQVSAAPTSGGFLVYGIWMWEPCWEDFYSWLEGAIFSTAGVGRAAPPQTLSL